MESIDRLVTSFLDLEASKNEFKRELASMIKTLPSDILDISVDGYYDGVVHQYVRVNISEKLTKDDLKKIPFDYVDSNGDLIFEVGDVML